MPHNLDLIMTLTGGLAAALVFGFASQRLRLSPIVGYLVAGVLVGPFTPGFTARIDIAEQFAEVGVILLMFGVGLHFRPHELLAVRRIALPGAIVQIACATALGVGMTQLFGWSVGAGLVFGMAIAVASTVVLLRVLADNDELHTPSGHIAVGWLIVEDLFTVVALVMLPLFASGATTSGAGATALSIGGALLKIIVLVAFTLIAGRHFLPKILAGVARVRSRELFTLTVLVIALGIAVAAAKLFGASMALGAFLAGMVVGQSEFSTRAASEALPMRDAFAVLFFVSMGMLLDPAQIAPNIGLIAGTLAIVLLAKPLAALAVVLGLGYPAKTAATVAIALAQIGEFSFILAALGRQLDILPEPATQALVATAIVSITINPPLFRLVERLAAVLPVRRRAGVPTKVEERPDGTHRAIVVGYGPVGQTLTRLMRDNDLQPTVIELNHDTVKALRADGVDAVYGDASQAEVLEQAGVREAANLVFAASGSPDAVVRQATALNPDITILSRTPYNREVRSLEKAGANVVVSAESEVALAMTEHLLRDLGASAEQLDRARDRLRSELRG